MKIVAFSSIIASGHSLALDSFEYRGKGGPKPSGASGSVCYVARPTDSTKQAGQTTEQCAQTCLDDPECTSISMYNPTTDAHCWLRFASREVMDKDCEWTPTTYNWYYEMKTALVEERQAKLKKIISKQDFVLVGRGWYSGSAPACKSHYRGTPKHGVTHPECALQCKEATNPPCDQFSVYGAGTGDCWLRKAASADTKAECTWDGGNKNSYYYDMIPEVENTVFESEKCDPKECDNWTCKNWCKCFKAYPEIIELFEGPNPSAGDQLIRDSCPSDNDECDCTEFHFGNAKKEVASSGGGQSGNSNGGGLSTSHGEFYQHCAELDKPIINSQCFNLKAAVGVRTSEQCEKFCCDHQECETWEFHEDKGCWWSHEACHHHGVTQNSDGEWVGEEWEKGWNGFSSMIGKHMYHN